MDFHLLKALEQITPMTIYSKNGKGSVVLHREGAQKIYLDQWQLADPAYDDRAYSIDQEFTYVP